MCLEGVGFTLPPPLSLIQNRVNKILFYTSNDNKITIAETPDSIVLILYISIGGFSLCYNFS